MQVARPQSLRRLLLTHELAFLTLVVIMGGLASTWAYFWQQSSEESIRLNTLAHTAQEIRSLLFKQIQEVSVAGLRDDPDVRSLNRRYARTIRELFNELRRKSAHRGEDYAVQAMQTAFSRLQADLRETLKDPFALNRLVRSKLLDPQFELRFVADFEMAFESFTGLVDQQLKAQEDEIGRWMETAPYVLTLPVVIGVALLIFSRRSLTQGFVRPMQAVMAGTRDMSAGDLKRQLPEIGVEEVRELARGINQMADELDASRHALVDNERQSARGALIPVIAHNIRNPLAAIRANAQLIDGTEEPHELQDIRAAIIETVDRLGRWVTALVSYLHPLKPERRHVRAVELMDAVTAMLASRFAEFHIHWRRENWDAAASIDADRELMEQALYGLVNNAIEASTAGQGITLAVERCDRGVRMTVGDSAGGLPFKPEATELTPGLSTKRFGTGLGIPIAYKICSTHGFDLAFSIREGQGTDVIITAPSAAEDNRDDSE
jgi:signal transduction histidine kinase